MIALDRLSHRRALLLGFALLGLVNAVALAGVYWNRGEETSRLQLTERELGLPFYWNRDDGEEPGVSLNLQWRNPVERNPEDPDYDSGDTAWLDAGKLAELGFDVRPLPEPATSERHPRTQERPLYLVLEFEGAAYLHYLQQRESELRKAQAVARHAGAPGDPVMEGARAARGDAEAVLASIQAARNGVTAAAEQLRQAAREDSRLFAVDAGDDLAALRRKYPDRRRYALVEGRVLCFASWDKGKYRPRGRVYGPLNEAINLPRPLAVELGVVPGGSPQLGPGNVVHFEATIAFGRRLEPWVVDVAARTAPR